MSFTLVDLFVRLPNVIVQLANVAVTPTDDIECPTIVLVCPNFGHGSLANVFIRPPDVVFSPPDDDFHPDAYVSEPDDDDFHAHEYVSEPAEHGSEAEEYDREADDDVFGTVEYVREADDYVSRAPMTTSRPVSETSLGQMPMFESIVQIRNSLSAGCASFTIGKKRGSVPRNSLRTKPEETPLFVVRECRSFICRLFVSN